MASSENGHFIWHDHMGKDAKAAVAFYTEVIGWRTQPFGEAGDYVMFVGSQGPLGGEMKLPDSAAKMGAPPHWMGYVQVDDVARAASRAKDLGGQVLVEPEVVPTVGRLAVIADPQGAALGLFTPLEAMEAHDAAPEGEFCWNELVTSDGGAAFGFYASLLGWKILDEMDMGPMGKYRIFGVGETRLGGMMTAPKDTPMPPMWIYYVSTHDLAATLARATSKGAKVVSGPMDIPGGARIAQLVDPEGAVFALHQAPKA